MAFDKDKMPSSESLLEMVKNVLYSYCDKHRTDKILDHKQYCTILLFDSLIVIRINHCTSFLDDLLTFEIILRDYLASLVLHFDHTGTCHVLQLHSISCPTAATARAHENKLAAKHLVQ